MVTPEAPVNVVKKAQMTTAITVSPPGIQPKTAWKNRTSLSPAWLSDRKKPTAAKSGMAGDGGPGQDPVGLVGDDLERLAALGEEQVADPPRTTKMGNPRKAAAMRTMIIGPASPKSAAAGDSWPRRAARGPCRPRSGRWTSGRSRRKSPDDDRRERGAPTRLLLFEVVMKRRLMARKPAAMIRTTSRFGRNRPDRPP